MDLKDSVINEVDLYLDILSQFSHEEGDCISRVTAKHMTAGLPQKMHLGTSDLH